MTQDDQGKNVDRPGKRRLVSGRFSARSSRILLAAVTGVTSGLTRATVDWLVQHFMDS